MKKIIFTTFICFPFVGMLNAQDIHFSQMEYSPLTLNPALAGVNAPMQGIMNYRSQWKSVASPYKTFAASFDARLNDKKRNKSGILVAGINFSNDQAGSTKLITNNANLSFGYHLLLNDKSTLGVALNTGFGQRSFDPNSGRWGSQFNGKEYDASLSSGETFASNGFSYFDAGTGIVYSYKDGDDYTPSNDGKSFNVGFAAYHVNKPKYSFMNNSSERLSVRYSAFANAIIGQRNSNWSFLPGVYYQLQGKAQEILIGSSVKYCVSEGSDVTGFNKSTYVSFGAYFRTKDAFILRAMLEWSDFSIGLAYDVNVSNLRTVSNTKGGAEIFLRYNMGSGFLWK